MFVIARIYKYLFEFFSAQLITELSINIRENPIKSPTTTSCGVCTPSHILENPTRKTMRTSNTEIHIFFFSKKASPPKTEDDVAECPLGKEYPAASARALSTGWILSDNTQGRYTHASILNKWTKNMLKDASESIYTPDLKSTHQYMIAQIIVGSQNSPKTVIDKNRLSSILKCSVLIFCKNTRKSICGLSQLGFEKHSIIEQL